MVSPGIPTDTAETSSNRTTAETALVCKHMAVDRLNSANALINRTVYKAQTELVRFADFRLDVVGLERPDDGRSTIHEKNGAT
jgi:hypothetical protein